MSLQILRNFYTANNLSKSDDHFTIVSFKSLKMTLDHVARQPECYDMRRIDSLFTSFQTGGTIFEIGKFTLNNLFTMIIDKPELLPKNEDELLQILGSID